MATGQNLNDITDLDAVKAKLTELMPQITTFWSSENDWNQFMSAGDFVVATYWSGSAARSIGQGLNISFVVPDEGALGWLDGLSIPASSTKQDAAHAFIDWMVDPDFYVNGMPKGRPPPPTPRPPPPCRRPASTARCWAIRPSSPRCSS